MAITEQGHEQVLDCCLVTNKDPANILLNCGMDFSERQVITPFWHFNICQPQPQLDFTGKRAAAGLPGSVTQAFFGVQWQ
jgi:hypothetical protein